VAVFFSCKQNHRLVKKKGNDIELKTCPLLRSTIFNGWDTTRLETTYYPKEDNLIEILDKPTENGERGLYKFDTNGVLRVYAFLQDLHNDASFIVEYDSTGKVINEDGGNVTQLYFWRGKQNIKVSFMLSVLNYNWGGIAIKAGKFKKADIALYNWSLTKLIGASLFIPIKELDTTVSTIYISGIKQNKCTKQETDFIDSLKLKKPLIVHEN